MERAPYIAGQLARFDPELPIERAETPPSSWYVDPDFLELEGATVFENNWVAVALAEAVAEPRSFVAVHSCGRDFLIVRDGAGTLRAFDNVCRHHAARLAEGRGRCTQIVCPYHGWSYGLDGTLANAPHVEGILDFDTTKVRLSEVYVREWGPFVFLCPGEARDLDRDMDGVIEAHELDGLEHVATREYHLRCNWKVFVDNYLDGGYHVPVLHSELASDLDLSSYDTRIFERFSVQTCGAKSATSGAADRLGAAARYVWIYPNLMLNRYGAILDTNRVVPLSVDETLVVFDWFFDSAIARDRDFVERSLAASERVQLEDAGICESVHSGLRSPSYDRGRYAPKLESGEHHFHRLLAADLVVALDARVSADAPRSKRSIEPDGRS